MLSDKHLPWSLVKDSRPVDGEFWVSVKSLEDHKLYVSSLQSKAMYKSIFKIRAKARLAACRATVEKTSTFVVNFCSYTNLADVKIAVSTCGQKKRCVEVKCELPQGNTTKHKDAKNGLPQSFYTQRFELKPNVYRFTFEFITSDQEKDPKENFLIKLGSTSECTFARLE